MREKPFENEIIIIGADHHNTLAAIRAFGYENCGVKVIIHGENLKRRKISVFKSKYAKRRNSYIIGNSEKELLGLLEQFYGLEKKAILFPTSDFAEMVIDSNYSELEKHFCLPGFVNSPGKVREMMDKWQQYLFAKKHGIAMAPTYLIGTENAEIPNDLNYPCIVKPRISAHGSKSDIAICEDKSELENAISHFKECGYTDALVQDFIHKKYEALSMGCIIQQGAIAQIYGGVIIKIREQLETATSFAKFVIDNHNYDTEEIEKMSEDLPKKINEMERRQLVEINKLVLESLAKDGYHGQYDVEYFVCEGKVYLNEINYRHSGAGFALINEHFNAPYAWACSFAGKSIETNKSVNVGSYMMVELCDKMYVKRRVLTLGEWIRDIKKAEAFAVFSKKDLCAALKLYCKSAAALIRRFLRR